MKTYRVTLLRAYIVGEQYDVLAANPEGAEAKAVQAAQDKRPDVRADALDTGWRAIESTGIREIGARLGVLTVPMRLVDGHPDVFEEGA